MWERRDRGHHSKEDSVEPGSEIFDGMDVYDWVGAKIGRVVHYDANLGYVQTEATFGGARYIPFSAFETVGPSGAYLNVPAETVRTLYGRLPRVTPAMDETGRLTGGGTVESGYTGRAVPLDADGIEAVRRYVTVGSHVFDSEGRTVGRIEAYDPRTGYMRIDKGTLLPKDLFLPATAISYLDQSGIHLSETTDSVMNHFTKVPGVARGFFAR